MSLHVTLAHEKAPLQPVVVSLHERLDATKEKAGRNAFSVCADVRSGTMETMDGKWSELASFVYAIQGFSNWRPGDYFVVVDDPGRNFEISFFFFPAMEPEDCSNNQDDNGDGDVDCDDLKCFRSDHCTAGSSGEDCANAIPLPLNGASLKPGQVLIARNTTLDRTNDVQGPCAYATHEGQDIVYRFSLSEKAAVQAVVNFWSGSTPALVLFKDGCEHSTACVKGDFDTAEFNRTLDAGTYYLAIDSGAITLIGFNGESRPDADDFIFTVTASTP